jgi:pilus assembly protein TadC
MPGLGLKLRQAGMKESAVQFVRQVSLSSLYMTFGVVFALFLLFLKFGKSLILPVIGLPIIFGVTFWYMTKLPDLKMVKCAKEIDKEIVFAGKFMIIELKSGVSLYQVMKNVAENYGGIGHYFKKIIHDIDLGTETGEAINNAIVANPSENFRKVMWQLVNSLQTGSDVSHALDNVLEQISRRQLIEVERYGKKLNPIAMFYLMMAIIIPSLGMVMGVILASFANIQLGLGVLLTIALMFGGLQFMFYATIKTNRPAVEM